MKRSAGVALAWIFFAGAAPPPVRSAPATAAVERAPAAKLDKASFRYLSWGATVHYWTVDGAGAVTWEAPEGPISMPPASDGKPLSIAVKRFRLDRAQHVALRAAIARAQEARALPDDCETYIPDGPYGRLTWTIAGAPAEEVFMVNASCLKGPQAQKAGAAFDVDAIVKKAAESAPIVDHRQE
jgi:hypothetical protein